MHKFDGEEFETAFLQECTLFINAEQGVRGQDIEAAMLCRDSNRYDLLRLLHLRRIQVVGEVLEDDEIQNLEFEVVTGTIPA
jgi:hypothetical protein